MCNETGARETAGETLDIRVARWQRERERFDADFARYRARVSARRQMLEPQRNVRIKRAITRGAWYVFDRILIPFITYTAAMVSAVAVLLGLKM